MPKNNNIANKIYPVILSGGSGTRLWPLSRASYPKQFLTLGSDKTLLQETVLRVEDPDLFYPPLLVSNHEHRFIVAEQLRNINLKALDILLEPVGRNTAAAILAAALYLNAKDPEALMLVLPSDHVMANYQSFLEVLSEASLAALQQQFVTFGIKATKPETGYGYLQQGKLSENCQFAYHLKAFVEKPDFEKAKAFVASGEYHWNSGMFLFSAKHLIHEMAQLYPDTVHACQQALTLAKKDLNFLHLDLPSFERCINQSIDYALLEKTKAISMVLLDCDWSDIGSWTALWEQSEKDSAGNSVQGPVVLEAVKNSYIRSDGPLLTVLGLEDIIAVVTQDAILLAAKDKAQQLKLITDKLKAQNRPELVLKPEVLRPWGSYQVVDAGKNFQVKRIMVNSGQKLSLQKHQYRSEHWVVVKGVAYVTRGEVEFLLQRNESTYIPVGMVHRLENRETSTLEIIEIQSGDYLGEDDIIRLDDVYNRNLVTLNTERTEHA